MKAMVLAAGKATRLRPLTDDVAKPALPFCGRAILDRVLDGLAAAGVEEAIVNLHHAPETVRDLVAARGANLPRVSFSDETRELLGTGGALVPVRAVFEGERDFLIVNGDCVHAIDVRALIEDHRRSSASCTLATRTHGEPGFGALLTDASGRVTSFSSPVRGLPGERHFLSVQVVSPAVFDFLPASGSFGSFTDWYPQALAAGLMFRVHETDAEWHALDSRELYLAATRDYLARRGGRAFIAPTARVAPDARVDGGSAVHDGCVVGAGAVLEGAVLLAGVRVGEGARVKDSILGAGARVEAGHVVEDRLNRRGNRGVSAALREPVAEALRAWGLAPEDATLLAGDASTRRYLRVRARATTHVVMDCGSPLAEPGEGVEPVAFLRWQAFYRALSIRVPEVRGVDRAAGAILLEDLGDTLLQDRVEAAGASSCAPAYARAAEWGVRLAREGTPRFDPASCPDEDPLTPQRLALEMDLFLVHAARVSPGEGAAALPPLQAAAAALDSNDDAILRDARTLLHRLCVDVHGGDEAPRAMALCHRDYHARNLLLVGGDVAVIDFQDTRRGPRAYDLASLAWDPYVTLPEPMIETLVESFRPADASAAQWNAEIAPCAGQRLLKAAGSYAWLSRARGQQRYARWLAPALARAHERLASWPPRDTLWELLRAVGTLEA